MVLQCSCKRTPDVHFRVSIMRIWMFPSGGIEGMQCGDGTNGEKARIVVTRPRLLAREKLRRARAVEESSATVAR